MIIEPFQKLYILPSIPNYFKSIPLGIMDLKLGGKQAHKHVKSVHIRHLQ